VLELKYTIEIKDEQIYSLKQMLEKYHLLHSSTDNDSCREDISYSRYGEFIKVCKYQRGNQKPLFEEGHTLQWPKEKGQTMIYKTLHRKQKIEQHEPH